MDVGTGIALLVAFLAVVVSIIRGQSPIIMLLLLAIVWAADCRHRHPRHPVQDSPGRRRCLRHRRHHHRVRRLVRPGPEFQTGIAESVIRSAVELAGDRPIVTAMTVTLVTALLFTSMYGVGAAIAIGVIALPIMMSQGIPPHVAAPVFTMGIGAGTFVNLVQFGTFQKLFPGIKYEAPSLTYWVIGHGGLHPGRLADGLDLSAQLGVRHGRRRRCRPRPPPAQAHALLHLHRADLPGVHDHGVQMGDHPDLHLLDRPRAGADGAGIAASRATLNLFNKTFFDAFPDIATIAALWTICGMIIVAGQTPRGRRRLAADLRSDPAAHHRCRRRSSSPCSAASAASIADRMVVIGTGAALAGDRPRQQ